MSYDPNQPYSQSNQPPYGQPSQPPLDPYGQPPSPYGQPPPPPPYAVPSYAQPPQQIPQKKSRRGLWIILSIIAGVLVLSCGACALLFGSIGLLVGGADTAVNRYYQAVEQQNYATAYTYLHINTVNEILYRKVATNIDTQKGTVTSHSIKSTNVVNNDATVLANVTRGGQTYQVTLHLQKFGNDWKITSLNNV